MYGRSWRICKIHGVEQVSAIFYQSKPLGSELKTFCLTSPTEGCYSTESKARTTLFTVANSTTGKYSFIAFIETFYWLTLFFLLIFLTDNPQGEPDYEMLDKFHEYQEKAEIYHLYHSIQRYTVYKIFPTFDHYPTFICLVFTLVN